MGAFNKHACAIKNESEEELIDEEGKTLEEAEEEYFED